MIIVLLLTVMSFLSEADHYVHISLGGRNTRA